jgi:hypothetical protein
MDLEAWEVASGSSITRKIRRPQRRIAHGADRNTNHWIAYSEGRTPSTVGVAAAKALEDGRRGDSNCGTAEHGRHKDFIADLAGDGMEKGSKARVHARVLLKRSGKLAPGDSNR